MADTQNEILPGIVLDDVALTLDELAKACAVEPGWMVERIGAGIVSCVPTAPGRWRITSAELIRARRLVALERDLDANQEVAALVVDLIEEVQRLRTRLRIAGVATARDGG